MSAQKAAQVVARLDVPSDEGDLSQQHHEEWIFLNRNTIDMKLLREISDALRRMEHGSYGVCPECEEPISAKRLDAVPWARYLRLPARNASPSAWPTAKKSTNTGSLIGPAGWRWLAQEQETHICFDVTGDIWHRRPGLARIRTADRHRARGRACGPAEFVSRLGVQLLTLR